MKFEGAYHGGHDTVLVSVKPPGAKVGHAKQPRALAQSQGIPALTVENTLVAPFNDIAATRAIVERHAGDVAAVIVEPVMMNVGVMAPRDGFLQELRALCDDFGCLLIFDEVKTGAKLAWGGAQEHFKVKADMVCLAKAVGGGLPLGAFGARREIMNEIAQHRSFHAGTYASNPLATTACVTALEKVLTPEVFPRVTALGDALAEGHNRIIKKYGHPWCAVNVGTNGTVFWRQDAADQLPRVARPGLRRLLALLAHEPEPGRDPPGAVLRRAVDGLGPPHPEGRGPDARGVRRDRARDEVGKLGQHPRHYSTSIASP